MVVSLCSLLSLWFELQLVARGYTAVVDAYLTPKIREYLQGFCAGFKNNLRGVRVLFMRSDGGLCEMNDFSGYLAILSGPAGGVVGYARTAYAYAQRAAAQEEHTEPQPVIGFDMGGTSTDVSRYAGRLEHVFETQTAGVTIQAPQLDITTVAAGGGSRLFFKNGMFVVGPESAGANPGPVCYRRGGHLAVTDANLLLGRVVPELFPAIFGKNGDQPLDVVAAREAFDALAEVINEESKGTSTGHMSAEQVALGFVSVANEAMCRPIRQLTEAKGHDARNHILACFGGAGGQHACAIARSLGIGTVFVHRYSGILSAYGIALSDSVVERQEALGKNYEDAYAEAMDILGVAADKAVSELQSQGFARDRIQVEKYLNLRYEGTQFPMMVDGDAAKLHSKTGNGSLDFSAAFVDLYEKEHGFTIPGRPIVIDDCRVRALGISASTEAELQAAASGAADAGALGEEQGHEISVSDHKPEKLVNTYFEQLGGFVATPIFRREGLKCAGTRGRVTGPCIIVDKDATIIVEPGCTALVTPAGDVVINIQAAVPHASVEVARATSAVDTVDRVKLSIFGHRFMGIAEQMGRTLQRTAISTNIKERLDFSCALFDPAGNLVANAPHIPVHLGSMQDAVRYQSELLGPSWKEGEVLLCNHPIAGGTHLPDVTVITPVYHNGAVVFFVASRGHQADIGGISPGSMPAFSKHIDEEGMAVETMKIVRDGVFQEEELLRRLVAAGGRCNTEVVSDIRAQAAANKKGSGLVSDLIRSEGLVAVHAYMKHIQTASADAVRKLLRKVSISKGLQAVDEIEAEDHMDDGTPIRLSVKIDRDAGSAEFDFSGTGPAVQGNTNAPRAIASSAIIYALRCMVAEDIPMNQGCLDPIDLVLPKGSLLNPEKHSAVAGGNVLTSQRITDVIFRAFEACAASQGCMNNFSFGSETMGYYETIGGGCGAGDGWHGSSGVQVHMTNTLATDSEILERRYPAIVRQFNIRTGSGGQGKWRGGDGIVREIEFTRPVKASILTERRGRYSPWGLKGGQAGSTGINTLLKRDGTSVPLGAKNTVDVRAGEGIRICTPGGGGYGVESG